ncbi:hypothetical protein [Caballeronia sp. TF1N1]|uniref:hypothetical protein n=1 Tax=Caballeronia sp. TF1N1 TaxID=2878153 RepID=UPI001FD0AABC|nr:hypothetical protein [Caballeronia sp. TF1N1]
MMMKAFLTVTAVLFVAGALGNLGDLARGVPPTPLGNHVRAMSVLLQGMLGAWAVYSLLRGVSP